MVRSSSITGNTKLNDVVIVSGARTPIGSFRGCLSDLSATQLGSVVIKAVIDRAGIAEKSVNEVFMGNVLQAGLGQAPARQAATFAGLPYSTVCTTVNKVCASGMKSVILAAQTIMCGTQNVVIAGGMESMSNVPYYLNRGETKYGGMNLLDGIIQDGLTDVYYQIHMGDCAENTAKNFKIDRKEQDEYAILSYKRIQAAYASGAVSAELVPVKIPAKKGKPEITITEDEEYNRTNFEKFAELPTVFKKENGTVTAANASAINDGAAAVLLTTPEEAEKLGVEPLAKILAFQDAATDPIDFTVAPSVAIAKLLEKTGLKNDDIALFEINEAFAVITLANAAKLGLSLDKVNIHGGAVSLGHPLAMSSVRILVHLVNTLKPGQKGIAVACNGGGGASAILIEKL